MAADIFYHAVVVEQHDIDMPPEDEVLVAYFAYGNQVAVAYYGSHAVAADPYDAAVGVYRRDVDGAYDLFVGKHAFPGYVSRRDIDVVYLGPLCVVGVYGIDGNGRDGGFTTSCRVPHAAIACEKPFFGGSYGYNDFVEQVVAERQLAVEVLRAICPKVSMKWPNDLWLNDGKLAGILCETCRTASGHLHVAVGIGVNIAIQDKLKKHLLEAGYPASSLFTLADLPKDVDIVRVHTAARLALALRRAVCEFSSDTISGIASRWDGFDAMLGQQVCFISDDGRMTQGIERGITQNGEIVIDDNGIRRVFSNGSLRPAAGKAAPVC